MAIVSVVLGVISIILSLVGIFGMVFSGLIYGGALTMWGAPIIGIIGVIIGIAAKGKSENAENRKLAMAGLLCSVAGVILSVVMLVVIFGVFSTWEVS